jgi:acyl carrier protein
MAVSPRSPEGDPLVCRVCGANYVSELAEPLGDTVCSQCGSWLLALREGLKKPSLRFEDQLSTLGDSLDVVELVMELEEEFDMAVSEDQILKFRTIADLIRFLRQQRDNRES